MILRGLLFTFCVGLSSCVQFIPESRLDPSLQVKTRNGIVQGSKQKTLSGIPYYSYRGIPFAQPPVNKLRFRSPQPAKNWKGILDATKDGSDCVQIYIRLSQIDNLNVSTWGHEDCLFVSVYTPKNPLQITKPLPVMVWIYGGAFLEGSSSYSVHGPDHLLNDGGVIIVSFNYRLGAFGFLSSEDIEMPGNYGLKDQLLALKWVNSNIRQFGGDPNQVTIFGESAGAVSVFYLMLNPKSEGLFQRAIAESGSALCAWALHRNPSKVAFDLAEALKLSVRNSTDLVEKLRNVEESRLQSAAIGTLLVNFPLIFSNGLPYAPVIEPDHPEAFITKDSYKLLENGQFSRVPLIVGVNGNEASIYLFRSNINLVQSILYVFDLSPQMLVQDSFNLNESSCTSMDVKGFHYSCRTQIGREIQKHFFSSDSFVRAEPQEIIDFFSEQFFFRPILKSAELMSRYVPVYFYLFSYEGIRGAYGIETFVGLNMKDKGFGAAHSEELWYLFRQQHFKKLNKADRLTSKRLVKLWTNFAKYSNPTPVPDQLLENQTWPLFLEHSGSPYLKIDKSLSVGYNFDGENRLFWNDLYREHSNGPIITY